MSSQTSSPVWARAGALLSVVFWGTSFVATKIALRELSPTTLIFVRFAQGSALMIVILLFRREMSLPPKATWPWLGLMGFVGIFVHQLLQVHGLKLTTATTTGWLIGLIPLWTAVLSRFVLKEPGGRQRKKLRGQVSSRNEKKRAATCSSC